jgi:Tol biopolymer transport system component
MKLLKLITAALFSITVLGACDFEERLSWSPDGKRMAVLADQLRLADLDSISKPVLGPNYGPVLYFRWLPDNHHALLGYRRTKHHLTKAGVKAPDSTLDYVQLFDFNGDIKYVQLFDFNGDIKYVKAAAGPIVFKSSVPIDDLRLSPNGKLAAISQAHKGRHKLSVVTLTGALKVVAVNVSKPDWARDSRSLYFFRELSPKDSGYITFIPVSTICNLPVADLKGALLAKSARRDLAQCAGELTSDSRLRTLDDGSLLFSSTPVKLPACGVMFGLQERALFRYRPANKEQKASLEQIAIAGPALASALDTFEPNQDGTKIAVLGEKGAVRVISLNAAGNGGEVTVLEKALLQSEANLSGSFGSAPCWRNAHELCFSVRNLKSGDSPAHEGEVVLQDLSEAGSAGMPARQIVSRTWPVGQIDFLKVVKSTKK